MPFSLSIFSIDDKSFDNRNYVCGFIFESLVLSTMPGTISYLINICWTNKSPLLEILHWSYLNFWTGPTTHTPDLRIAHCFTGKWEPIYHSYSYGSLISQPRFLKKPLLSLLSTHLHTTDFTLLTKDKVSNNLSVKSYYSRWIPHSLILHSIKIKSIWSSSFIYLRSFKNRTVMFSLK